MLNSCGMETVQRVGRLNKVYTIPSGAYLRKPWGRWRWLVLFAMYFSFMFAALTFSDFIFKQHSKSGVPTWAHNASYSLFLGLCMSLFALAKPQGLSALEIKNDSVVLYEGEAVDPLYRSGQVVPGSEIRDLKEVRTLGLLRCSGLLVRYGGGLFGSRRFLIPSGTPDYTEIKELILALRRQLI